MSIDPKIGAWINFIFLILSGVAGGAVEFGNLDPSTVSEIKTIAAWGIFVITAANTVFHLYSAPAAGPLAK